MSKRKVIAFPSDMQCGSTRSIMPTGGWKSNDGQVYYPSPQQEILMGQWDEGWDRVNQLRKGSDLVVVSLGESIDGDHHGTTQLVTRDVEEQKRMHIDVMNRGLDIAKFNPKTDSMYYIKSTEVHTGGTEDAIARDFISPKTGEHLATPVIPPSYPGANDGSFAWDALRLDINGVYIIAAHQIFSGGRRAWTKTNTMRAVLQSYFFECLEFSQRIPRYIISAHIHRFLTARIDTASAVIEGITTPSFQYKTRNAYRGFTLDFGTIGMLIVVIEPDGTTWWECPRLIVEDTRLEKV